MKKPLLFFIFVITILIVFLVASLNVASVNIETVFGSIQTSVFLIVLFSFLIGAFCMFVLQIMGAKEEAITQTVKETEESPHYNKAILHFTHGNYEKAIEELNKMPLMHLKIGPLVLKLKCLIKLNRVQEAQNIAELARSSFPGNIELLYLISDIYIKCNQGDKAKDIIRSIIALDFKNAYRAYLILQDLLIEEGDYVNALKIYEDISYHFADRIDDKLRNKYYGLCYKIAFKFIEEGNYKEALYYSKQLLDQSDQFPLAYYIQALIFSFVKEENQLMKVVNKGVLKTKSYILLKVIEDYYLSEFNPAAAIEFYKNIIYESKNDKILLFALGLFYQRLEMIEDAINVFDKLLNKYPHWQELGLIKAYLCLKVQRKEDATELFERYLSKSANAMLLFKCEQCGTKSNSYMDKCEVCNWWGMINLFVPREEEMTIEPVMWAESIF